MIFIDLRNLVPFKVDLFYFFIIFLKIIGTKSYNYDIIFLAFFKKHEYGFSCLVPYGGVDSKCSEEITKGGR